jgi:hypothetical protein
MRYLFIAALVPVLAFAQSDSADAPEIALAKTGMMDKLKDPDSAKFKNLSISKKYPWIICGEVNAKNSYGGYVGYERFIAFLDRDSKSTVANVTTDPDLIRSDWPDYCGDESEAGQQWPATR